ncbi:hypothetical protein V493_03789 [Pseudogymnoascus sp. VKM F-4281 (FW-2241)]|nr:hypothetical protein V493_03789 [Pseudogymnoascus sp. VKM F-4281 (FW-2241)]
MLVEGRPGPRPCFLLYFKPPTIPAGTVYSPKPPYLPLSLPEKHRTLCAYKPPSLPGSTIIYSLPPPVPPFPNPTRNTKSPHPGFKGLNAVTLAAPGIKELKSVILAALPFHHVVSEDNRKPYLETEAAGEVVAGALGGCVAGPALDVKEV